MGMRSSDATFLRREILPILRRWSELVPEASAAADKLTERLATDSREPAEGTLFRFNRWHRLFTETGDSAGWHVTLEVEDHEVPYIHGVLYDEGEHTGFVHLTLDRRFGIDTTVDELSNQWAWFLANAMAVSAGRTSHGEHSFVRNPHGRSGGGDPPPTLGTPPYDYANADFPPHDDKGRSEERCVRCGWVMGQPALNCLNDNTPHVFPSQIEARPT